MRLVCNFSPYDKSPILSLSRKQLKAAEYDILSQLHPIPQEWIDELTALRRQEEVLIDHRKRLVASWCAAYNPAITTSLANLSKTHPEIYI